MREERGAAEAAMDAHAAAEARMSLTEVDASTAQVIAREQLESQEMLGTKLQDELAQASTDRRLAVETLAAQIASTEVLREQLDQRDAELMVCQTGASQSASQQLEIARLNKQLEFETAEAERERKVETVRRAGGIWVQERPRVRMLAGANM